MAQCGVLHISGATAWLPKRHGARGNLPTNPRPLMSTGLIIASNLPALVMIISLVQAWNCLQSLALHRRTRMLLHVATPTTAPTDDVISDVIAGWCADDVIVVVVLAHAYNSQPDSKK